VAARYKISREAQDEYSLQSRCVPRRASSRQVRTTRFVRWKPRCWSPTEHNEVSKETIKLAKDEGNRPDTNKEGLAKLQPVMGPDK